MMRRVGIRQSGILAALVWAASLATGLGASIGINFSGGTLGDTNDPPTELAPSDFAGAFDDLDFAQSNWNNLPEGAGQTNAIVNDSGAAVAGIQVEWVSANGWAGNNDPTFSPDDALMYQYIDDTQGINTNEFAFPARDSGTQGCWVTISNIPYASYHVVIYGATDDLAVGRPLGGYAVGLTDGRLLTRLAYGGHPFDFDGFWTRIPPSQVDWATVSGDDAGYEGNHVVYPNLTESDLLVIGIRRAGTTSRGTISAVQIIEADLTSSDGDTLPDEWELVHFGNLGQTDTDDPDGDQVDNATELANGSNPNLVNSDTDALTDWQDIRAGFSPALADTDGDGIADDEDILNGPDTDVDGLSDPWELLWFGDLTSQSGTDDFEPDGLDNVGEQAAGTDPTDSDSDDDGLLDGVENNDGVFVDANQTGSDPLDSDSDDDSLSDGSEVSPNPYVTNPNSVDTDLDTWLDQVELAVGTDPTNPSDFPVFTPGQFGVNFPTGNDAEFPTNPPVTKADFILGASETAGAPGYAQQNWNNANVPDGGAAVDDFLDTIVDRNGAVIPDVMVTYTAANTWGPSGNPSYQTVDTNGVTNVVINGDTRMLGGYLDDGAGGSRVTITNIPYATYDLVLYFTSDGGNNGGLSSYTVQNAAGQTPPLIGDPRFALNVRPQGSEYLEVSEDSISAATAERGNYTVFRFLRSGTITIVADQGAPGRAPVCGFQIINVDPLNYPDLDNDGMTDQWELDNFPGMTIFQILPGDNPDNDGLTNLQEFQRDTDPNDEDSDNDTVIDGTEVTNGTNPNNPDSDSDGLGDGVETDTGIFVDAGDTGTDPLDTDTDNDGLEDGDEVNNVGTDPLLADTDTDTFSDGFEVRFGSNPLNSSSTPVDNVAEATSINLRENNANQQLTPADVAGLIPVSNWNDVVNSSSLYTPQPVIAVDSTGATTPMEVRWTAQNAWGDGNVDALLPDPNARIARGYFDDGDTPSTPAPNDGGVAGDGIGISVTVSNVPYTNYAVILYMSTDNDNATWGTLTVNGESQSGGAAVRYATVGEWIVGQNAKVFGSFSDSTLTIRCQSRNGTVRSSPAGIQIIDLMPAVAAGPAVVGFSLDPTGGTYNLSWDSMSGTVYKVESVSDPVGGTWADEAGSTVTATGATTSHEGTLGGDTVNYRVVENPAP